MDQTPSRLCLAQRRPGQSTYLPPAENAIAASFLGSPVPQADLAGVRRNLGKALILLYYSTGHCQTDPDGIDAFGVGSGDIDAGDVKAQEAAEGCAEYERP